MEFYDLSALSMLFKSLYSHIRGKKGETEIGYRETWNSTTATLVLLLTGVQLRHTGSTCYVTFRCTILNTMDIHNEKMDDMWESAPGIEQGSSA